MTVRVIAKDAFPLFAVAPWVSRAEAHETMTTACRREANASGLSRFDRLLGAVANGNERQAPRWSVLCSVFAFRFGDANQHSLPVANDKAKELG